METAWGTGATPAPDQGGSDIVKAGRGAAAGGVSSQLALALDPVADLSRNLLRQLRRAQPDGVEVEFGVILAAQAGVVIAKSETSCHLKVKLAWNRDGVAQDETAEQGPGDGPPDAPADSAQVAPAPAAE
ncbi:CU044_2847 family protein [Streptomyces sp. HM190]|uniref:CU044_2847 family protein n=1 Tax=Streptomyces sp. HM190 TaxID=2695266 RepID=UPI001917389D|nr:CU044_2847 family protein [Streptomyces sp. HM190]